MKKTSRGCREFEIRKSQPTFIQTVEDDFEPHLNISTRNKTPVSLYSSWYRKSGEIQSIGGSEEARTLYLIVANDALSQVSYRPSAILY